MKKPKPIPLLPTKAKPPTVSEKLQQALLDKQKMYDELRSSELKCHDLRNENTRLVKLVEDLKEKFFDKTLALAHAEGQLQRVDHEDAERAEVVLVEDVRTTKVQHDGGFDVNGPAIPFQRAVLKYDLGRQPPRMTTASPTFYDTAPETRYGQVTEKPKHWVNRH